MSTENQIYLCSDLHLGHEKLYSKLNVRPEDFELQIFRNFTAVPWQKGDVLINLGDLALYRSGEKRANALHEALEMFGVNQLLAMGNHDPASIFRAIRVGVDIAVESITLKYGGYRWIFSHEPVEAPEGSINVHGHFHELDGHRGRINADGSATTEDKAGNIQHFDGLHILLSAELMDYRPITLSRLHQIKATPKWNGRGFEGVYGDNAQKLNANPDGGAGS